MSRFALAVEEIRAEDVLATDVHAMHIRAALAQFCHDGLPEASRRSRH
jgi:hypothetical protein